MAAAWLYVALYGCFVTATRLLRGGYTAATRLLHTIAARLPCLLAHPLVGEPFKGPLDGLQALIGELELRQQAQHVLHWSTRLDPPPRLIEPLLDTLHRSEHRLARLGQLDGRRFRLLAQVGNLLCLAR